jgi:hypothetical protein
MTLNNKPSSNDSTIANILLSLGTKEEGEERSSIEAVKNSLPSFKQMMNSPRQESFHNEDNFTHSSGRCSACQFDRFACFKCRPDLWITCNDVVRSKYPYFKDPYTRGLPFEQHAADYIRHRRIKSFNLSRNPDYNAYIIPVELQNDYFYSFQQNFPIFGNTPFRPSLIDQQKPVYPGVYPHFSGYKRHAEYAYYPDHDYNRKRIALDPQTCPSTYPTPPAEQIDSSYSSSKSYSPNKSTKSTKNGHNSNEMDPTPRAQPVKSKNDQYTPRWVRFSGAKKEGLCHLCIPEKWLQLKDSAFW